MQIPRKYLNEYVSCIPKYEDKIMEEVRKEINQLNLIPGEKLARIEDAENSRICDLMNTINVELI